MRHSFLPALLCLLAAVATCDSAAAAPPPVPPPIRVSIKSIMARARSQAPQTVVIGLECEASKLYEGRLEIKWYLGKRLVHDYLSQEMVVTGSAQKLRVTLPPIVVYSEKTPVTAYPRFHTRNEVIELKESDLVFPTVLKRAFVVANLQPQELLRPQWGRGIAEALGPEQFNPRSDAHFDMLTYVPRLIPEELPLISAGYASFDLLLLEDEGFQKLKRAQLTAIGNWVDAGGSVVVAPEGILTAAHVQFLNRLAGRAGEVSPSSPTLPAAYSLSERGELVVGERALAVGKKLARYRAGLGRAVIVHEPLDPQIDFETHDWKAAVAFLWKLRAAQVEAISRTGFWDFTPPPAPGYLNTPPLFAPQHSEAASSVKQLLMPERIEGVPLKVVVVILSLFLLAIAPGDYFLLGRLNCRKYTWGLFGLVSATFTICTVLIAEHYMGRADYGTSLTLVDLQDTCGEAGHGPAVARSSRFNLVFVATQRAIETSVRNGLFADLTEAERQYQKRHVGNPEGDELDLLDPDSGDLPVYEGTMPASFAVHQQLRQWSPRLTRQTTLEDDERLLSLTKINWDSIEPRDWSSLEGRKALFEAILAGEPEAHAMLVNGKSRYESSDAPQAQQMPIISVAQQLSARSAAGLFAIVSQISPTGGENLEDLALFDETDPNQWLLLVALRRDGNWVVYRKSFHVASSGGR